MDLAPLIKRIQTKLGVAADGIAGLQTWSAISRSVLGVAEEIEHHGKASSFADPADVVAFKKWFAIYKSQGKSDDEATDLAFAKGDNGIGCWGDDTTSGSPACALPPDDMIERWGSQEAAKHALVEVTIAGQTVLCVLKDEMPWKKDITNSAIIDLNPPAIAAFHLVPPVMVNASWKWFA